MYCICDWGWKFGQNSREELVEKERVRVCVQGWGGHDFCSIIITQIKTAWVKVLSRRKKVRKLCSFNVLFFTAISPWKCHFFPCTCSAYLLYVLLELQFLIHLWDLTIARKASIYCLYCFEEGVDEPHCWWLLAREIQYWDWVMMRFISIFPNQPNVQAGEPADGGDSLLLLVEEIASSWGYCQGPR